MPITNVEFGRWGTASTDDKPAAAIMGCVVHYGGLVEFGGHSHRLEEPLVLGKSGSWWRARSQTRRSCMPELESYLWPF